MDTWMTLEEVAQYLKVSRDSIYRLAQKGKIPASKIGNLWRFKREEIDQWMRHRRNSKEHNAKQIKELRPKGVPSEIVTRESYTR